MNQKKTSKKTSLFEPTYSSVTSVSKDSLRIAAPILPPQQSTASPEAKKQAKQSKQQIELDHDFELKKYYENLNTQFNLNLAQPDQSTAFSQSGNQTLSGQLNSAPTNPLSSPLNNPLNNQLGNLPTNQLNGPLNSRLEQVNQVNNPLSQQQSNLNPQSNDLTDEAAAQRNYSSYFGINRLTNYFTYNAKQPDAAPIAQDNDLPHSASTSDLNQAQFSPASDSNMMDSNYYQLPKPHWFYKVPLNDKRTDSVKTIYEEQLNHEGGIVAENLQDSTVDENWLPFAFHDSNALEKAYQSLDTNANVVIPTNGDRYDCYIKDRFRRSVYWKEDDQPIRRCTWYFKKEGHTKFIPYTEQFANKLEQIYYDVLMNNKWNQRIEFDDHFRTSTNAVNQEMIIFYSYNSIIHYEIDNNLIKDEWNTVNENPVKPKVVNRELTIDELENYDVCLKDDELYKVDHLVFLIHGVGAICDFRLRSIKEVVDDFRKISLELTRTHFRSNSSNDQRQQVIGRCEFIPVYWHDFLHGNETGIDERLKTITLQSVPKLRAFANDSLLDALFYTSQMYCQHIVNVVADEINRLYDLFISRNPYFKGTVTLSGHSLGSVILFDLLANQGENQGDEISKCFTESTQSKKLTDSLIYSNKTKYHGQESIKYPKLKFKTDCFFALGSPISMFLMLRGFSQIDPEYHLPDCLHVFNIFHPLDPIAYRLEPMINQEFVNLSPITIPHHKGRKRMHIEIKENLVKMGSDIKEKVLFGIKSTWNSVGSFVRMPRSGSNLSEINEQLNNEDHQQATELMNANIVNEENELYDGYNANGLSSSTNSSRQIRTGSLNNGSRIDYVLQEKPIEFFNQYIFALATHACYWSSEDCVLFMLKELYKLKSIYSIKDLEDANVEFTNSQQPYQQPDQNLQKPSNYDSLTLSSNIDSSSIADQSSNAKSASSTQQAPSADISTSIDIE